MKKNKDENTHCWLFCILCFHKVFLTYILFVGGGRIEIAVDHTLTVDGHIMANSEDVLYTTSWAMSSGGSGGSILINTVNYTGNLSDPHQRCN